MEKLDKWLSYINESIKGIIEHKPDIEKERVENAMFHLPKGDLKQEEAL